MEDITDIDEYRWMVLFRNQPHPRHQHHAARQNRHIVVFGGCGRDPSTSHKDMPRYLSLQIIWLYNSDSGRWKWMCVEDSFPCGRVGACIVTIDGDIHLYGGHRYNRQFDDVWKLSRYQTNAFRWIQYTSSGTSTDSAADIPCPRSYHTGWDFENKLWVFGGKLSWVDFRKNPTEFLQCTQGQHPITWCTNQLYCFDPKTAIWCKIVHRGNAPSPLEDHQTTCLHDTVWLYGSYGTSDYLFTLGLNSLTWTQIHICGIVPPKFLGMTFDAISMDKIILHGTPATDASRVTWVLDIHSLTWRQYTGKTDHNRQLHTASVDHDGSLVIYGGIQVFLDDFMHVCNDVFTLRLQPKSLEVLALQTVHKHKDEQGWKILPPSIYNRLKDM